MIEVNLITPKIQATPKIITEDLRLIEWRLFIKLHNNYELRIMDDE